MTQVYFCLFATNVSSPTSMGEILHQWRRHKSAVSFQWKSLNRFKLFPIHHCQTAAADDFGLSKIRSSGCQKYWINRLLNVRSVELRNGEWENKNFYFGDNENRVLNEKLEYWMVVFKSREWETQPYKFGVLKLPNLYS